MDLSVKSEQDVNDFHDATNLKDPHDTDVNLVTDSVECVQTFAISDDQKIVSTNHSKMLDFDFQTQHMSESKIEKFDYAGENTDIPIFNMGFVADYMKRIETRLVNITNENK